VDTETRDVTYLTRKFMFTTPQNQGYGKSVNEAVARSDADLILNSDTAVYENFLPLLCEAFSGSELAVISLRRTI
jgi:hypothetical protein